MSKKAGVIALLTPEPPPVQGQCEWELQKAKTMVAGQE